MRSPPLRVLGFVTGVAAALAMSCTGDGERPVAGFSLGVASGDVTATSAILWTRSDVPGAVRAVVATDPELRHVVARIDGEATPERDLTVQVTAGGLEPARRYFFRFEGHDGVSDTATFRTAPPPDSVERLAFVFSGDSDGTRLDGRPAHNEFEVLDRAREEAGDFFLYFGDTIYADAGQSAATLDEYRAKYRENRGYRALRDLLASTPVYVTWDDHEVFNDFDGQTVDPARMQAGRQAFGEYFPVARQDDGMRLYRAYRWGKTAQFFILDGRQYRSGDVSDACGGDVVPTLGAPGVGQGGLRAIAGLPEQTDPACLAALADPSRTMLGARQLSWLKQGLLNSDATWKFVVNSTPMMELFVEPYDRWEGYAAERRALLDFIVAHGIRNVVFLTTDWHATIFGEVRLDTFSDPRVAAYEFIVGPIATTPLQRDIEQAVGEAGVAGIVAIVGGFTRPDCYDLDSYSYAVARIDPERGALTVTAKDDTGAVLCRKELTAR
jgi:alkaline phosphatase D